MGRAKRTTADLGLWCGPHLVNLKRGSQSLGAWPYDQILDAAQGRAGRADRPAGSRPGETMRGTNEWQLLGRQSEGEKGRGATEE